MRTSRRDIRTCIFTSHLAYGLGECFWRRIGWAEMGAGWRPGHDHPPGAGSHTIYLWENSRNKNQGCPTVGKTKQASGLSATVRQSPARISASTCNSSCESCSHKTPKQQNIREFCWNKFRTSAKKGAFAGLLVKSRTEAGRKAGRKAEVKASATPDYKRNSKHIPYFVRCEGVGVLGGY